MYLAQTIVCYFLPLTFFILFYLVMLIILLTFSTFNRNFLLTLLFFDLVALNIIIIFIVCPLITNCVLSYGCALVLIVSSACDLAVGLGLYILLYRATGEVCLYQIKPEKSTIKKPYFYAVVERIQFSYSSLVVITTLILLRLVEEDFGDFIIGNENHDWLHITKIIKWVYGYSISFIKWFISIFF